MEKYAIKQWVCATENGELLCKGNYNKELGYHLACLPFFNPTVLRETYRKPLIPYCSTWNKEVRLRALTHKLGKEFIARNTVKPVCVKITIEPARARGNE